MAELGRSGAPSGWQVASAAVGAHCKQFGGWPTARLVAMAEDGVSLPPSVSDASPDKSDLDLDAHSDCQLPPPVGGVAGCSCRRECFTNFTAEAIDELRGQRLNASEEDRARLAFESVRVQICDADGHIVPGYTKWTLKGIRVCRPFWEHAHAVGHGGVDRAKKLLLAGASKPLERLPRMPAVDAAKKYDQADAWFFELYQGLGEPLPVADPAGAVDMDVYERIDDADHPLWALRIFVVAEHYAPKRYLNPGCFEDLWMMHEVMEKVEDQVSKSTLRRVWCDRWKKFLPFRNVGQGKRCRVCAKIDQERVQATTTDERAAVAQEKKDHIRNVMADRVVSVRANRTAEQDAKQPTCDGIGQVLKITIDGMDQAKFRCPRNLASSAEFDACFRPQLHMVGTICHGHFEAYFIMDADQAKDANANCTIISRCLDLLLEGSTEPGTAWPSQCVLPRTLIVAADNTSRESKNQIFLNYMAYLVATHKFEATETQFLQTGHTHNELDQRFSSVGAYLSRSPVLEDPHEFAASIRASVTPPRGRALHVEVLESTHDFQTWFFPLDSKTAGLVATHAEPDTNHVWRFLRTSMLVDVLPPEDLEVEVMHKDWKVLRADDSDVVLVVQQYMHSTTVSQKPLLLQPHEVALRLRPEDLKFSPRNPLGDRLLREYRKTAQIVGNPPWNLVKAQAYLEKLCQDNEKGGDLPALEVHGWFRYQLKSLAFDAARTGSSVQVLEPRRIMVEAPGPAERRRRAGKHLESVASPKRLRAADNFNVPGPGAAVAAMGAAAEAEAPVPAVFEDALVADPPGTSLRIRPAAASTGAAKSPFHGCAKCRSSRKGCKQCQGWADSGQAGYRRGPGGEVLRPQQL
jgi:hypothetical protein